MTEWWTFLIVFFATILGAFGSLFFKRGAKHVNFNILEQLKNFELIKGFFFYVSSALIFIIALKYGDLSVLYPITSLSYIWVSLISIKYLNEEMNKYKWLGIALIVLGVIFIGK
ncbi:EamA family transporter [Nanoarchaeota archaeon]